LDFVSVIIERIDTVLPMNLGIGSLKAMHKANSADAKNPYG